MHWSICCGSNTVQSEVKWPHDFQTSDWSFTWWTTHLNPSIISFILLLFQLLLPSTQCRWSSASLYRFASRRCHTRRDILWRLASRAWLIIWYRQTDKQTNGMFNASLWMSWDRLEVIGQRKRFFTVSSLWIRLWISSSVMKLIVSSRLQYFVISALIYTTKTMRSIIHSKSPAAPSQ